MPGSHPAPTLPLGRSRRVLVALGVLLLTVGGVLLAVLVAGRRAGRQPAIDPAVVAVLPFRVTAPDHSLDYLGEGLVDLLAVKLDGSGGPRAVPPRQLLAALHYRPGAEVSSEAADAAVRRLGAGRVLDGSLLRSGAGIELSATLRRTSGEGTPVEAATSGPLDSLPALVDRLAARLLAEQGEASAVLGELSSSRAIAAWLRGRAAQRRGLYTEAEADDETALREDSTFALAALDQFASALRANDQATLARAGRLAWTWRARLGPQGQALLRAWLGPRYPAPSSMLLQIAAWQEAVQAAADVPDAWFGLGDLQFHFGALYDLSHPLEHAEANFRRAIELDSAWVLPLEHLLLARLDLGDTAGFRALVPRWVAEDTVPGDRSSVLRWWFGRALGDSTMVARGRAGLERAPEDPLVWLIGNAQVEAVGLEDEPGAIGELERRAVTGPKLWHARQYRHDWLLNIGRPAAALALTDSLASGAPYRDWAALRRVDDALFWDGDTATGARTLCRLGLWSLHGGEPAAVRAWSARLRAARGGPDEQFNDDDRMMCADLLEAWLAWREGRPEARKVLDRGDSAYLGSDVFDDGVVMNLVTARLREAIGDTAGAARVIGRVPLALPISPAYWSTYLREQARIWLATRDTARAARALRQYVALRADPEPALRAERDSARARLAGLVRR